ncbi:MAG: hypothetical protein ABSF21_00925 [Dehalococcoidia bacterium]
MAKLWDMLSPINKVNLAKVYKNLTGLDFVPPKDEDKRKIHVEAKLEAPEELERIMQQSPNYSVDVQGREG